MAANKIEVTSTDQIINRLRREARTPEQVARQAAASRKWRLANAEQVRKIHSDYYARNRELVAAKSKARREARKQCSSSSS